MIQVFGTAPESPAASANGTVKPSDMPMTTSRTNSLAVKCRSMWAVWGIAISSPEGPSPPLAASAAGVALEPVVEVIVPAPRPGPGARDEIRRDERPAPALDLANVRLLVVAAGVERR